MNQLIKIDKTILNIAKKVEKDLLNLINPINSIKEKKIFFFEYKKYTQYNPKFEYATKINFDDEKNELIKMKNELKNSLIEKIFLSRIESLLKEINLLEMTNTKKFCNNSKKTYGEPNNTETQLAKEIIIMKTAKTKNNLNAEQIKNTLQKALIGTNFDIELKTNMSAKASVNLTNKKLYLNSNSTFNQNDAKRFIVHEIETHIYRYLNGVNQPIQTLSIGAGESYLKTEEGLAIFNEEQTKTTSIEQEKIIAGRLYAVRYALTHDFFDTFDEMKNYFDEENAYIITQRVKRGIPFGEKGSFTKDYCYYSGLLSIKDYFNSGKSLNELYYGKISTDEIKIVKKIKGIQEPKYLPKYLIK